jgi:hypothetical protein
MKRSGSEIEESYQKTKEAEVETLGARVAAMQEEAEKTGGEIKTEFKEWRESLQLKQILTSQLLENLKYVTGDIWKGLMEGFENAEADFKECIAKVHPNKVTEAVIIPLILPLKPAV